jgi:hypothetical protein
MKALDQEPFGFIENFADEAYYMVERFKDRLSTENLRLAERYINLELKILVAFTIVSRGGKIDDFIADYQARPASLWKPQCISAIESVDAPTFESKSHSDYEAMLVDYVKLVEFPERLIPSYVRLHTADEFLDLRTDSVYFSAFEGRCVLLGGLTDRKHRSLVRGSAASFNKLPGQVIQGASNIMNSVADHESDVCRNRIDARDIKRCVENFRLFLSAKRVGFRLAEIPDCDVQVTDVLFGPFNFKPDPVSLAHT